MRHNVPFSCRDFINTRRSGCLKSLRTMFSDLQTCRFIFSHKHNSHIFSNSSLQEHKSCSVNQKWRHSFSEYRAKHIHTNLGYFSCTKSITTTVFHLQMTSALTLTPHICVKCGVKVICYICLIYIFSSALPSREMTDQDE